MLLHYLFIAIGAALGGVSRVALTNALPAHLFQIPTAILIVNIIGCFSIGVLTEVLALHTAITENLRYFLIPGFLGGFTTFSAFTLEFGLLYEKNLWGSAILYASMSVLLCFLAFFGGLKLIRIFS